MANVRNEFRDGILYQIEYKPELSINTYTQRKVYYIKTDEENYPRAKRAIASIMENILGYKQGEIWSKGEYLIKNKNNPSMLNAFHIHYDFTYDEEEDVYVYTFVRPYDD